MSEVTLAQAAAPVVSTASGSPAGRTTPSRGAGRSEPTAPARLRLSISPTIETYLAIGVVAVVALLIVPLPPFLLDAFLALSFGLSIVILLVVLSARDPLEFSIFPSLLLLITLLRLGLNVSSTRLILSTGHAGKVISAFGSFVIGGNTVVGLVIFLILVVINFVVITKGAGRIAEVAARFTLDAMPGRQMSIDADLGAGLIDEMEARRRREEISRYADFYGSMDGAAKFVRGDAIAGILITAINLIGGFVIGMTQQGLSAGESLQTYSSLTVGDGLVTQIPALIVSTAAGILVTYGSGGMAMGPSLGNQLTRNPRAIGTAGAILALFAIVPGLPAAPFLLLAGVAGGVAYLVSRRQRATANADARGAGAAGSNAAIPSGAPPAGTPDPREVVEVEPLELEIGYALVPLVDESQSGDLLQRIGILRKQLAFELGMIVPPARIRDNIQLSGNEYVIRLRGVRVASGELLPRHLLALDTTGSALAVDGLATRDPSFGIPAVWIGPERRSQAEASGYTVVEPPAVLATHLMETIRDHAAELLTRQATRELLDGLKETNPALVEDVIPNRVSLGTVHRVLQKLLREGIPIRDLAAILETLSDAAEMTKDPEALAEQVRRALSLTIVQMLGGTDRPLQAVTVGPRLEVALMQLFSPRVAPAGEGQRTALEPEQLARALESLSKITNEQKRDGQVPPLVTPPSLRVGIRKLIEPTLPRLPVISLAELPPQTPIQTVRIWELPHAA
ncbi:MAG: flagellar biosynthesis protein FlhA [Candidatus Eisenbacteria bacterium]